jgi:hypothetical protein
VTIPELHPDIAEFYDERYDEIDRLAGPAAGRLERERTRELLGRVLPPAPAEVLDVGGGPGVYAARPGWPRGTPRSPLPPVTCSPPCARRPTGAEGPSGGRPSARREPLRAAERDARPPVWPLSCAHVPSDGVCAGPGLSPVAR